jgi:hypothetical protein
MRAPVKTAKSIAENEIFQEVKKSLGLDGFMPSGHFAWTNDHARKYNSFPKDGLSVAQIVEKMGV